VATEAPHTSQTRGFYRTQTWWRDKNQPRIEIPNLTEEEIFTDGQEGYYSSYDNSGVRVCARDSWSIAERLPYLCGEFRWTGIDYYGEAFQPARLSQSGVIDSANFPKDHYYLYQSMWRDPGEFPMVHILPHWTHPNLKPRTVIPVWIYTNCDEVELFLNSHSLGRKKRGTTKHLSWDVAYEKGRLEAVAYYQGREIRRKKMYTAGDPMQLLLSSALPEKNLIPGDVVQIDVAILDTEGTLVPWADSVVHFIAEGISFVGIENGDALDLTPLSFPVRKAFHGLLAAAFKLDEGQEPKRIVAASLLGNKIFSETTKVAVAVNELTPGNIRKSGGINIPSLYDIYYTLDGSFPSCQSRHYTGAFTLTKTTRVRAVIYRGDSILFSLDDFFVQGERPPYVDHVHTNRNMQGKKPAGPFSEKLTGIWTDKNFCFSFKDDGSLFRIISNEQEQPLGYWWYDYPVDTFENPDYAGQGEIWFFSGEKEDILFDSQKALELVIDNTQGAVGNAWGHPEKILLKRLNTG
jgi:beta-galactosidase